MRYLRYGLLGLLALAATLTNGAVVQAASTFTVDSTGDAADFSTADGVCDTDDGVGDGPCTLRAAIEQANVTGGTDTINFSIGTGVQTISPGSALPTITDPVIIDGTTQPDFVSTPIVELDGTSAGAVDGLNITAGSSTVRGLVINRFSGDGIELTTNGGNTIEGNYIGTDTSGSVDEGNGVYGVYINDVSGNTAGGTTAAERNIISGNDWRGVQIEGSGATGNVVEGNYIGTDVNGTADLGNTFDGLLIYGAPSNTIGGTASGARNVISGNGFGVSISGSGATGNVVQGNYIGTDVNGTADLGNSAIGVYIERAPSNTIGGTTAGAANIISGNDSNGVYLYGSGATGNQVQGNYIGTDVSGTLDLGNLNGVVISGAPTNTIGGTTSGARNVISGNGFGVFISGSGATGNVVQGNYIGTDVNGTADLGNLFGGVWITDASSNNTIGGTAAGAVITIAFNGGDGVQVDDATATGNTISGNSIYSNVGNGIENINGGNTELAPPVIDSVGSASGHTDPKCYPCTVEIYSDDEDEGRIYHGSTATNDDATGTWTYPGTVTGPNITATVTDAPGNTSEFSTTVAYSSPVGGIAGFPDIEEPGPRTADPSDGSSFPYSTLAGGLAAAVAALAAGGWYARRRRAG